jgi:oligopeptidase A
MNPLLKTDHLPDFAAVEPAHIQPAIEALLTEVQKAQEHVTAPEFPADLDAMERVLDVASDRLGTAWGIVGHLNGVADTPALREAYNAMLPAVSSFYAQLGADERLYAKYKAAPVPADAAAARALKLNLQGFVLGGAELQGEAKARFQAIQERGAELGQAFSEHVMDATDGFKLRVPAERLHGVPADVIAHAKSLAESDTDALLTLHAPSYIPVLQYAHDRALREQLYRAYATRASELGEAKLDNSAAMQELLALRQEEAALLGYPSFAAVSLATKMADSPAQVLGFLRELAAKARPFAEADLAAVRAHAKTLGIETLEAWDMAYVSEALKTAQYAVSEQALREYFTLPAVLDGLFALLQDMFGLRLTPLEASQARVWHASVRSYALHRGDTLVGHVYLDLLAREGKRPGAWMDDVRGRWRRPDTGAVQTPVAHLVCNFAPGANGEGSGKPSLLTHDDVQTLFHEWGHGLHHLLTQIEVGGVSGIDGVEWDAVELPSQFFENLAWEWHVIQRCTRHVETGEPMPRPLFDKAVAAKNFQAGLQTLRQVEFALFDMRLHAENRADVLTLMDEVRAEVSVFPPPAFNRMPHSFSHVFAGGYAAGYYSYKWAEVLSADCWAAFEEEGVTNPATGQRFLDEILARGGSRPALESFVAFRGREPSVDALLKSQGMA